jgi:hypothetical protein
MDRLNPGTVRIDISQSGVAFPYFIRNNEYDFSWLSRPVVEKVLLTNGIRAQESGTIIVSDALVKYLLILDITCSAPGELLAETKLSDTVLTEDTPKDADEVIYCAMKMQDATEVTLKNKSIETFLSRTPNAPLWQILMVNQKAKVLLTEVSIPRLMIPDLIRDPISVLAMVLSGYLISDGQILIAGELIFVTKHFGSKPNPLQAINTTTVETVLVSMKTGVPIEAAEALSSNTK